MSECLNHISQMKKSRELLNRLLLNAQKLIKAAVLHLPTSAASASRTNRDSIYSSMQGDS